MPKINMFDRSACEVLRKEMDFAIQNIANKFGISIRTGNGKFTDTTFTLKIEMACVSENGEVSSKEAEEFKMLANSWGMKPEDLHKTIIIHGTSYQITGSNCRSYRFPITAKNIQNGKGFKLPLASVKAALGYKVEATDFN